MRRIAVLCLLGVVVAACRGVPLIPRPAPTPTPATGPGEVARASCEAFRFLAVPGLPLPSFLPVPGPQVSGSISPTSATGRQVEAWLRRALEAAGGPAQIQCVYEATIEDAWGLWVVYALQRAPEPSALRQAVEAQGAEEVGTISIAVPTGRFGFVHFRFPVDGRHAEGGFLLLGEAQVIALAGFPGELAETTAEAPSARTPTPVGTALAPAPTPTSEPESVLVLPERVAEVDEFFRPLLEEATGRTFVPHQYSLTEQGGMEVVHITYRMVGASLEDLGEVSKRLSDALKAQGASMVSVEAEPTRLTVIFLGLPYKGRQVPWGGIEFNSTGEVNLIVQIAGP